MRDRKRGTVTAIKPEALRLAVGGGERVGGSTGNRKSRGVGGSRVSFVVQVSGRKERYKCY